MTVGSQNQANLSPFAMKSEPIVEKEADDEKNDKSMEPPQDNQDSNMADVGGDDSHKVDLHDESMGKPDSYQN
jgi:hypothetical protein